MHVPSDVKKSTDLIPMKTQHDLGSDRDGNKKLELGRERDLGIKKKLQICVK